MNSLARLAIKVLFCGLAASATSVGAAEAGRRPADWSGEARVQQATGQIKPTAGPVTPPPVKPNGLTPTAPVTCTDQNASSPACYTATQQSRPVTR